MCMPVRVKNVPPNCGTDGAQGFVNGVMPSWISLLHSMPCSRTKAAPKNMVANNQLRVRILSPRWAANMPNTMVSELDSRQAVMMVALMMLSLPNGVGQLGFETRPYPEEYSSARIPPAR